MRLNSVIVGTDSGEQPLPPTATVNERAMEKVENEPATNRNDEFNEKGYKIPNVVT